ncbi:MAG: phospholipid carrier-dependent glycosyltransferase, partial [Nitrospirae bacterium]
LLFVIAVGLFRYYYIYTGPLRLSPDEAQYWDWSRTLQWSYYSKPPMVAYLIRLSTEVLGNTELGVRAWPPILSGLSSIVLYFFTVQAGRRIGLPEEVSSRGALLAGTLLQVVPVFATYGVIMTIDAPLILFWSLGLLVFSLAIERGGLLWGLLGLVVGLGMLTKFTMVFFVFSAGLFFIMESSHRAKLKGTGPWVSLLLAGVLYLPVLYWNHKFGWVYFKHLMGHATGSSGTFFNFKAAVEFIGSQLGVITFGVFFCVLLAVVTLRRAVREQLLYWFSLPVILAFLLRAFHGKVQANWPIPGYIAGLSAMGLCVSARWGVFSKKMKAFVVSGIGLSVLITLIAHYPKVVGLPARLDPSARLKGWDKLAARVDSLREGLGPGHFVFSDSYQVTAELAFYLKDQPRTYCAGFGRRMNQYDLWEGFYDLKGYDAVFVRQGLPPLPAVLKEAFKECKAQTLKIPERGKTYTIALCRGFKGMKRPVFKRF